MEKIYRFFRLCAGVVLTFALLHVSAFAIDEATIQVSNATVQAGECADIAIVLQNNPGIASMTLHVSYDRTVLELLSVNDAGILGTTVHNPDLKLSPYVLCWANDTVTDNFTVNGTIATLCFMAKESAVPGNYSITVSYDNEMKDEIIDVDLQTVDFAISNGNITVKGVDASNGKINDNISWTFDKDLRSLDISGDFPLGYFVYVAGYRNDGKMTFLDILSEAKSNIFISDNVMKVKLFLLDSSVLPQENATNIMTYEYTGLEQTV